MINSLKRVFRSGLLNFSRDGGMMVADIFIMAMTISVITSLFLFQNVSQFLISDIQEKIDVAVYFKTETLEDDILRAKEEIAGIPEVKEVNYVSRAGAFDVFIEKHKENPVLMESLAEVGANPFLASLNIQVFEASQFQAVANFLESADFQQAVAKVDYAQRKPVIERMFSFTSTLNKIGIGFSIVLAIVAILIAFNSVRLAIYNCQEEIKIQRLVGASNWFIRGPFLVQGALVGLLAALICFVIFGLVCWAFGSKFEILFSGLNLFSFYIHNIFLIFLMQIFVGVGLGTVSSLIAIRRYLEV